MTLVIGKQIFPGVEPGTDLATSEAMALAENLLNAVNPIICREAVVSRKDGMVLMFWIPGGPPIGRHFRSALAGYEGNGPEVSARILALFGFGLEGNLRAELYQGGENAFFSYKK